MGVGRKQLQYKDRLKLARDHGADSAFVYELIYHQDAEEPLSHRQVAKDLGLSVSSTQRIFKRLAGAGLLKVTRGKDASRYQVVTLSTLGQSDRVTALSQGKSNASIEGSEVEEDLFSSRPSLDSPPTERLSSIRVPWGNADLCRWYQPSPDSPVVVSGERLTPFSPQLMQFLAFFEYHVAPRAGRKITMAKRQRWLTQLMDLVLSFKRPIGEAAMVVTWIFTDCDGIIPIPTRSKDRKLTRIDQITWNWVELQAAMRNGLDRHPIRGHNYAHELENVVVESQVNELVKYFAEFRTSLGETASEFQLANWRKTFRIMLHHDRIDFDSVVLVVTNLRRFENHIDLNRYRDAFYVRFEFSMLFDSVSKLIAAFETRVENRS